MWHRGHCNTNEELEMKTIMEYFHHRSSKRQLDSIQSIPIFCSYITPKKVNTESHKPVHNFPEQHYAQEPKGENNPIVHQQMRGESSAVPSQAAGLFAVK